MAMGAAREREQRGGLEASPCSPFRVYFAGASLGVAAAASALVISSCSSVAVRNACFSAQNASRSEPSKLPASFALCSALSDAYQN